MKKIIKAILVGMLKGVAFVAVLFGYIIGLTYLAMYLDEQLGVCWTAAILIGLLIILAFVLAALSDLWEGERKKDEIN